MDFSTCVPWVLRCKININENVKGIQNNVNANVDGNHWTGFEVI